MSDMAKTASVAPDRDTTPVTFVKVRQDSDNVEYCAALIPNAKCDEEEEFVVPLSTAKEAKDLKAAAEKFLKDLPWKGKFKNHIFAGRALSPQIGETLSLVKGERSPVYDQIRNGIESSQRELKGQKLDTPYKRRLPKELEMVAGVALETMISQI